MLHIYGLPCNQNDLKWHQMISKAKISVASFCCHKVLLLWTKTVYFFVDNRMVLLWQLLFLWMIGFIVANVVFVEDWFRCGKCCYYGRLVLLWQVLLSWMIGFVVASVVILEVHSQLLIRSLLSPNWTRRLLQNVRLGSLGISDLDYRCSINRLVLSWSFYWMSSFPIYSPGNLGNLSVLGKSLINAVKV